MRASTPADTHDPRCALALFYAAQFAHMGVVLPFLAPWLEGRGFAPLAIGALLALPPLFKLLAPWSWGRWADRSGLRRELLVVACVGAAAALGALARLEAPFWTVSLIAVYAFLRAPILPYVEATTLEQSETRGFDYGSIRLWGSVAFMAVAGGYGWLSDRVPADTGPALAAAMLAVAALPALLAFPRPLDGQETGGPRAPEPTGGARRGALRFFAACALMQASHGAYYTFYSIHLQNLGYGGTAIGLLWALGVLCEILLLTRMDRIVERFGSARVMHGALLIAAVRWIAIGMFSAPAALVPAQALHAVTYAAFHVAAIREVYRRYGSRARARGQAMFSGLTYGLGMFLGSLFAGWVGGRIGLPGLFLASAGIALVAVPVLGSGGKRHATPRGGESGGESAGQARAAVD